MIQNARKIFGLLWLLLLALPAIAQEEFIDERQELNDAEIRIEKDAVLEVPRGSRLFDKMETIRRNTAPTDLSYQPRLFTVQLPLIEPQVSLTPAPPALLPALQNGLVRLGFGNYVSPMAEAYYTTTRHPKQNAGVHAYHRSWQNGPVNGSESAEGLTRFSAWGTRFTSAGTFKAAIGYQRHAFNFYGATPEPDGLTQTLPSGYQLPAAEFAWELNKPLTPWRATATLNAHYLSNTGGPEDRLLTEAWLQPEAQVQYLLSESSSFSAEAGAVFSQLQHPFLSAEQGRNLLSLQASYRFRTERVLLRLGAYTAYNQQTDQFHVYPIAEATTNLLNRSIEAFASLTGEVQPTAAAELVQQMPFTAELLPLQHQVKQVIVEGGLRGREDRWLGGSLTAHYERVKFMPFWLNNPFEEGSLRLLYDESPTNYFALKAAANVQRTKWQAGIGLAYHLYLLDTLAQPWHQPQFTAHNWVQLPAAATVANRFKHKAFRRIESIESEQRSRNLAAIYPGGAAKSQLPNWPALGCFRTSR